MTYKLLSDSTLLLENGQFCIGRGSNGTAIYIGYHLSLESWVAIKCCFKAYITNHEVKFIQSHHFRNQHSNIGSYLDCIEEDSTVYIIMELYEATLEQFLCRHPDLSFKAKCRFAIDLLKGINFLHELNIIHRDLKPQNILIDLSGNLKIVDFGISREIDFDQTTTYQTFVRGTLFWLPPELVERLGGKGKIKKNDEIRVAVMLLFYIFSGGKHPFRDSNNSSFKQYCDDVASANFRTTLSDPFLQKQLEIMFKDTKSYEDISDIINGLNKSHRLKDIIDDKDCEIYERSSGKRYAILVSCSNLELELAAARADVTILKSSLEHCGFSVEARDGISKANLLSSEIKDDSNRVEPIGVTLKQINDETISDEDDIYTFSYMFLLMDTIMKIRMILASISKMELQL